MNHRVLLPVRATSASLVALATASALLADSVDDYLRKEMQLRQIPGLAYAVVDGEAVARSGFLGLANLELQVPVSEKSIFAIASLDKQLTAAGVMKLVELGKIQLEDDPARLLDLPWPGLQVRHLLSHTSGLPDEVGFLVQGRELTEYDSADHLDNIRSLVPLAPPGLRYHYSDANLFLAQLLTEKASGEPWRTFVQREIFSPAGMRGVVGLDPAAIVPGRVSPYRLDAEGRLLRDGRLEVDYGPLYNDLGMTIGDFASWLLSLGRSVPLSRHSLERMWTPTSLADGGLANEVFQWPRYGFGFGLDELAGERLVAHSGSSGVGYVYFPDSRFGVVVFTNLRHTSGSDPVGLALAIAGLLRPQLDLVHRSPRPSTHPGRVEKARALYESMLDGKPSLELVALRERTAVAAGTGGLSARKARFGALETFVSLGEEDTAHGTCELFRARHARAHIVVRAAFDEAGNIRLWTWSHL
jgi:D-alanyl-D-alanine carboxypeptidase